MAQAAPDSHECVFYDAIHQRLNRCSPCRTPAGSLEKLSKIVTEGLRRTTSGNTGEYDTRFANITGLSKPDHFRMTWDGYDLGEKPREEIELHILLESHCHLAEGHCQDDTPSPFRDHWLSPRIAKAIVQADPTVQPPPTTCRRPADVDITAKTDSGAGPDAHRVEAVDQMTLRIPQSNASPADPARCAPREYSCAFVPDGPESQQIAYYEPVLLQGLASGQGVFQVVSEEAQVFPDRAATKPIIDQLHEELQRHREAGTELVLGNRFEVESLKLDEPRPPVVEGAELKAEHLRLQAELTVIDRQSADRERFCMRITQVGLEPADQCLRSDRIISANNYLDEHQYQSGVPSQADVSATGAHIMPIIAGKVAQPGVPVMILFHEIASRIKGHQINDNATIAATLDTLIAHADGVCKAQHRQFGTSAGSAGFSLSIEQKRHLGEALVNQLTNRTAMANAGLGVPDGAPSLLAAAFECNRFELLQNPGGGDCLFHSLETSERDQPMDLAALTQVRWEVAMRLLVKDDSEKGSSANAQQLFDLKQRTNAAFNDRRDSVTNAELALCQAMPTNYAGEVEWKLWLELPRNHGKTIVMVDAVQGSEQVTTYGADVNADTGEVTIRVVLTLFSHNEADPAQQRFEDNTRIVDEAIFGPAVNAPEGLRTIPPDRIVIYRTSAHFARVSKLRTPETADERAARQAAEIARQLELAKTAVIAELGVGR